MDPEVAVASRRERRTAETRRAIVAAAEELFAEQGYGDTTIEAIAERADIAPRTFFRYFPTKESVLFADAAAKRALVLEALRARPPSEHPFVSLVVVLGRLADETGADVEQVARRQRIAEQHPSVWAYQRSVLETDGADALAGFVAERLGVDGRVDPRPRVWAALCMATFRVAFHLWLDDGRRDPLRRSLDRSLAALVEAADALTAPVD